MTKTVQDMMIQLSHALSKIVAEDVWGAQNMMAPLPTSVRALKTRYAFAYVSHVDKQIYNTFLRLNNRRKTQGDKDFENAGYHQGIRPHFNDATNAYNWCVSQFGKYGFWYNQSGGSFWFVKEEDATMFQMVWG